MRTVPARPTSAPSAMLKDVVCGMDVAADTPYEATYKSRRFVFCSEACLEKFWEAPDKYASAGSTQRRAGKKGVPPEG